MADVHSSDVRSYNMSKIRSKDTKTELLVRKFLFSQGFRFKLHDKKLPGQPDIVLPKYKTVIFVHGCFWHGHENCQKASIPKTRTDWWLDKILKNTYNDRQASKLLKQDGWNVLIVWECKLQKRERTETLTWLAGSIRSSIKPITNKCLSGSEM